VNLALADLDVLQADRRVLAGGVEDLDEFAVVEAGDALVAGGHETEERRGDDQEQQPGAGADQRKAADFASLLPHEFSVAIVQGGTGGAPSGKRPTFVTLRWRMGVVNARPGR